MKRVVSISIGSSKRDHRVQLDLLGEEFLVWREGTDGDTNEAVRLLQRYDSLVNALGLGGIGLFFNAAGRTYWLRDGKRYSAAVEQTPLLDGMGLKGAVEGDIVRFMEEDLGLRVRGQKVLMTSAVDRWGMAMAFEAAGCEMSYGDLLYSLGIPVLVHSHQGLERLVRAVCPIAVQLPFEMLYPYEADHTTTVPSTSRHAELYRDHKIIAGDFKYVEKYMPADMSGRWVVTNTTTTQDVELLRQRGVELLVTTTPRLEGRSFGTNVIEATLVALDGASQALPQERYLELMRLAGFKPDVIWLQR